MPHPPREHRIRSLLVVAVALALAAAPARAQQQPADAAVTRAPAAAREVRLTLTVTNEKGHYIGGVGREHVEVFEGKAAREIKSFGQAEEHASVGVLFDISSSILEGRGKRLESARQAFARFVQQASPANEYFLRAFNKKEIELTDWTRDPGAIRAGLDKIAPATVTRDGDGATAFYDACAAALAKLAGGPHPRRVLIVFTDGFDTYSRQTRFKDLRRMVQDSEVLLYAVAIIERGDPSSLDLGSQAALDELAAVSGGAAYFPGAVRELNGVMDRIAVELRHQYVVGFAPADAAKRGGLNKVRVKIKPPPDYKSALRVRSREGYLTPE